jgi:glutaredoxin 3
VPEIVLYTTHWCGFCTRARALLERERIPFREIALDDDAAFRRRVFELGGQWTVPLVTVDGDPLGGYRELATAVGSGRLAELLSAA